MKTKTHITLKSLLIIAFLYFGNSIFAQHQKINHHPKGLPRATMPTKQPSMLQAQKVLKRTQFVILKAKIAVNKGQNYTGDLAKAVAHQKQAKKFYLMKNPNRAILHSRQARMYAFKTLQANKAGTDVDQSYQFNKEENAMIGTQQDGIDLDKDLEQTTFNDKAVTDKEMTDNEVLETPASEYKNE